MEVKRQLPGALGVFVLPPDEATLLKRLRGRGRDSEDVVAGRFAQAQAEIAQARASGAYDCFIVNDDLETAVRQTLDAVRERLAYASRA
jgi:guanylate kinase